jgi:heat shock protein HslJ
LSLSTRIFYVAAQTFILAAALLGATKLAADQDLASPPASTTEAVSRPPQEIHWNLIELDGSPVTASNPDSQPYIYLQAQGDKLSGSGGCNRLFGSYDLNGSALEFHSVASTMMACPGKSMDNEARILEVLKLVTNFVITGDVLSLRVDDHVLARFKQEKQN